jgi:maltose alpha-D-glucosyltransferase / alpha-amylase
VPLIYYGDELGMKYIPNTPEVEGSRNRSGTRTPMQWDSSENAGFSTAPKDKIYIPIDPEPNRPTVAKEDKDPTSQLNYVRDLLKLRESSAALGNEGALDYLDNTDHPYPMIYVRRSGTERYLVALNPSGKGVETKIPAQGADHATYFFGTNKLVSYETGTNGDTIKLPAISAAIFKLDR